MSQAQDNITPIKSPEEETEITDGGSGKSANMDLSKIAIVVSLLSVVLSVIFFFGLNRNLSGLSNEVRDIGAIRSNVDALDTYVDGLLEQMGRVNTRILELEAKPRKEAVRVLQESMIDDMLRRTEFMGGQLADVAPEDAVTAEKLERLRAVLQELRWPNSLPAPEVEGQDSGAAQDSPQPEQDVQPDQESPSAQ